jgi:periplasmic protein TonB
MTAVTPGPSGPDIFSTLSDGSRGPDRVRGEAFVLSLLAQGLLVGLLTCYAVHVLPSPQIPASISHFNDLHLIFSGHGGGGGGGLEKIPASRGNLPPASLSPQLVPPAVMLPREMPKLVAPETVMVAPEVKLPQGGPIGDPLSQFTRVPSNGPGGPGGIGPGCCDGVGPSTGPGFGPGPSGIFPAGRQGVTVPEAIYHPEPGFSDEARKSKTQGAVVLLLIVGKDGRTHDIRVGQSLGMGLDEKAVEAVSRWRFKPATLNGQPVATQIAVELDFHLY